MQGAWQRMGDSAVLLTYSLPVKSANPVLIPFICTIVQTSSINLHFSSWFAGAGRVRKSPRAAGWLVASSRGSLLFGPASRLSHRSAWWQEEVQGGQVSCAAGPFWLCLPRSSAPAVGLPGSAFTICPYVALGMRKLLCSRLAPHFSRHPERPSRAGWQIAGGLGLLSWCRRARCFIAKGSSPSGLASDPGCPPPAGQLGNSTVLKCLQAAFKLNSDSLPSSAQR